MTWFFLLTPLPALAISSFLLDHFHEHENMLYPLSSFKKSILGPPMALQVHFSSPHLPFLLPYHVVNPFKPASVLMTAILLVKATLTLRCYIQCPYVRLDLLSPLGNRRHSDYFSLLSTLTYLASRKSHTPACPPDSLVLNSRFLTPFANSFSTQILNFGASCGLVPCTFLCFLSL